MLIAHSPNNRPTPVGLIMKKVDIWVKIAIVYHTLLAFHHEKRDVKSVLLSCYMLMSNLKTLLLCQIRFKA